jgi:hypothetical protein
LSFTCKKYIITITGKLKLIHVKKYFKSWRFLSCWCFLKRYRPYKLVYIVDHVTCLMLSNMCRQFFWNLVTLSRKTQNLLCDEDQTCEQSLNQPCLWSVCPSITCLLGLSNQLSESHIRCATLCS